MGNPSNKFLKEYYSKVQQRNISNQENYPIIQAIQILMKNRKFYEDSALNIFTELSQIAEEKLKINLKDRFIKFPKHYNQITKHLKVVKPLLKSSGFEVNNYHWYLQDPKFDKNTSVISISKIEPQKTLEKDLEKKPSLSSLPSLKKKQSQKTKKSSESSESKSKSDSKPSLKSKKSSHEKQSSDNSESSEGKIRKFFCHTCQAGEFGENESTSLSGNIVQFHRKQGHDVRLWEKKENV